MEDELIVGNVFEEWDGVKVVTDVPGAVHELPRGVRLSSVVLVHLRILDHSVSTEGGEGEEGEEGGEGEEGEEGEEGRERRGRRLDPRTYSRLPHLHLHLFTSLLLNVLAAALPHHAHLLPRLALPHHLVPQV